MMADGEHGRAPSQSDLARATRVLTSVNGALLVCVSLLAFLRSSVGAAMGLWHDCVIDPTTMHGSDGWYWPLLLALVPFLIGLVVAAWSRGFFANDDPGQTKTPRGSRPLLVVSVVGAAIVILMWLVPTSTCVA
jgi:uncharacterized membrane protein YeaQ/YmgE (transglycosylase-associated protein family)